MDSVKSSAWRMFRAQCARSDVPNAPAAAAAGAFHGAHG